MSENEEVIEVEKAAELSALLVRDLLYPIWHVEDGFTDPEAKKNFLICCILQLVAHLSIAIGGKPNTDGDEAYFQCLGALKHVENELKTIAPVVQ